MNTTIKFYRLPEVLNLTGYSRPSIYRLMNAGEFPQSVRLGSRAVAWRSSDIDAWMASRPSAAITPVNFKSTNSQSA
ncbi:AlpA family transcriptional regulator [Laribacter hongkongensis]|uniref:AlpA family transcriptional regulator n=2 Tax=Laribacter hongkongensis TaxID=168471 RepID=A0ABD4SVY3_9NEIS|nr:AlpA family transcriptional regulator [Laribacter hongkongensis]MCG9026944.1 AlpA family transcriptional regulator [Laribacter hongkongensis]MCG9033128.1 AlpA family transcriptional regulator [Laribacter hongkongensis]MCG9093212.1 AlpA family transcriptional regulator [Laribacter hongkongensis]MCG9100160.1 AlpA family transcriptional regulator [Laribacter hongkongensis]MCG9105010.1 AlpA family transcriptional regulator [Laribacter hongkongensis]